MEFM
jgi:hypothetical protein